MTVDKLAKILIEGPDVVASEPGSAKSTSGGESPKSVFKQATANRQMTDPAEAKAKIDKKIAVYMNRLILRIFSVPSLMSYLKDVVLFQDDQAADGQCKIQLVFHRLPDEAHPQLSKLVASPRDPKFTRFVDKGQARTGVEIDVQPEDFGGEDFDYAF